MKNSPRSRWSRFALVAAVPVALVVIGLALRNDDSVPASPPPPQAQAATASTVARAEAGISAVVKSVAVAATETVASSDPRAARIEVAGQVRVVTPNARGEFPRVVVPASSVIAVSVPFAGAQPGELLPVQSEDGAVLLGAAAQGVALVAASGDVPLSLKVAATDGLQRVTLRRGGEMRVLEFWVGAEPHVLVRN